MWKSCRSTFSVLVLQNMFGLFLWSLLFKVLAGGMCLNGKCSGERENVSKGGGTLAVSVHRCYSKFISSLLGSGKIFSWKTFTHRKLELPCFCLAVFTCVFGLEQRVYSLTPASVCILYLCLKAWRLLFAVSCFRSC